MKFSLLRELRDRFLRAWYSLNREEHHTVLLILGLFLLGLCVWCWRHWVAQ